jgi:DNA-binding beta-propeller fold protein YncE
MRARNTRTAHGALLAAVCAALACCAPAAAAPGDISTVAGTTPGFAGDGGPAIAAQLAGPYAVAPTPDGGFLIADFGNSRVRKVSAAGAITTVAGSTRGYSGDFGPATAAQLSEPSSVAPTRDGGLLIADTDNYVVRKVRPDGTIVTVAGTGLMPGFSGDGGAATSAKLAFPYGVAPTPDGGFLIADTGNRRIRKVFANGTIVTVAGTTTAGYAGDGGPAVAAQLDFPYGVAPTPDGGFLIADAGNQRIRRVRPDGTIVTAAGAGTPGLSGDGDLATSAMLHDPIGVTALADGGFLIADELNDRIRRVSPAGVITTVAGTSGGLSGDGGPAIAAQLSFPTGVAVTPTGELLIADFGNGRIRAVTGPAATDSGGGAPTAPIGPIAAGHGPAFGARTNVLLTLTHSRIAAGGRLGMTVRNANAFPISGSLTARARDRRKAIALAAKRFAVAAHGHTRVTLDLKHRPRMRLARRGRLTLAVTATVTDPAGHTRRVTATLTVKRAHAHRPANRRG